MLAASADLCWRDRSRFSSANNHLVGELAGLATVAMLFPELAPARTLGGACPAGARPSKRPARSCRRRRRRAGGGLPGLHSRAHAGCRCAAQVARGHATDRHPRRHRQERGLPRSCCRPHDPDPRYGDDDEGFAMRLGPEPRRTVRDHLGIVAALTGNERARRAGTMTLSALWVDAITGTSDADRVPERAVSSCERSRTARRARRTCARAVDAADHGRRPVGLSLHRRSRSRRRPGRDLEPGRAGGDR